MGGKSCGTHPLQNCEDFPPQQAWSDELPEESQLFEVAILHPFECLHHMGSRWSAVSDRVVYLRMRRKGYHVYCMSELQAGNTSIQRP